MRPHFFSLWWVTFRTWTGCTWNWSGLHPEKEAGSLKVYVSLYLQMVMTSSQTLSSCSCMTKQEKNTLMQVYLLVLAKHTWTLLAGDQTYCITNKMLNFWLAGLALIGVEKLGWNKLPAFLREVGDCIYLRLRVNANRCHLHSQKSRTKSVEIYALYICTHCCHFCG